MTDMTRTLTLGTAARLYARVLAFTFVVLAAGPYLTRTFGAAATIGAYVATGAAAVLTAPALRGR
jgi:hypothetical protein